MVMSALDVRHSTDDTNRGSFKVNIRTSSFPHTHTQCLIRRGVPCVAMRHSRIVHSPPYPQLTYSVMVFQFLKEVAEIQRRAEEEERQRAEAEMLTKAKKAG